MHFHACHMVFFSRSSPPSLLILKRQEGCVKAERDGRREREAFFFSFFVGPSVLPPRWHALEGKPGLSAWEGQEREEEGGEWQEKA